MPFLWPACFHQWSEPCPPHPSPASSLHGPEVGIWPSCANLLLSEEFLISVQRSLFIDARMLDIQTDEFFRTRLGGLSPVCTLSPKAGLRGASERRPQQPQRVSAHNLVPDFPIPAILPAFRVRGTSRHPSNESLLLASLVWAGSCSSHQITTKRGLLMLHSPGSEDHVELKKGQRPGARSQGGHPSRHTPREGEAGAFSWDREGGL